MVAVSQDKKGWVALRGLKSFAQSLSGRLLVLTVAIVMLAEILIYVPSIARYRETWLMERLEAAQIAVLALEGSPDQMVDRELADELLRNAEVFSVGLSAEDMRELYLGKDMPPKVDLWVDMEGLSPLQSIMQAFDSLRSGENRVLGVRGQARFRPDSTVEIVIDETPLCQDMFAYSRNILGLSIVIALVTAGFVYACLMLLLVRPMLRITTAMETFRQDPEKSDAVIAASDRTDEIGRAERELAEMQSQVQSSLQQKAHLAALGVAVSKINHDLKNILTSAQLVSDRIANIDDPTVQRLAPMLFSSIDRAIDLCVNTLRYGKAEEAPVRHSAVGLKTIVEDVAASLGLDREGPIKFHNEVSEKFTLQADSDKLFRMLLNLTRNAQQALLAHENPSRESEISVRTEAMRGEIAIDIIDNGPGIPEKVREELFKPFGLSATPGGTGLGLAIARDLAEAHGGKVILLHSGSEGTCFRVCLPELLGSRHVEP